MPTLIDGHGRVIDYLRVSVTDRCDLRCTYCLPQAFKGFEEPANWLTHDEMARLVSRFVAQGVRKVRLTGGEPLLRRGVCDLAARIKAMPGVCDLSVSTNATRLDRMASGLKEAGVDRLNISLDSLDEACMTRITGRNCLNEVLAGIRAASQAGFRPIKLNMVVQDGVNDQEVMPMVMFAREHGLMLRLIEPMPVGDTGRATTGRNLSALGDALARELGLVPQVLGAGLAPLVTGKIRAAR